MFGEPVYTEEVVEDQRRVDAEVLDFRLKTFDDSKAKLREEVAKAKFKILDIGPGFNPPLLSIELKEKDLWVGVDPALGFDQNQKVDKGNLEASVNSKRILIPGYADEAPPFKADLMMLVAPNPKDIAEGDLLDQLEKFFGQGTQIYILLDRRTNESRIYGQTAGDKIKSFLKRNGFVPDDLEGIGDREIDISSSKDAIGGRVFKGKKVR